MFQGFLLSQHALLGCFRDFFWPVKKCEFPTVMVGVLLLADITKVPRLPLLLEPDPLEIFSNAWFLPPMIISSI